MLQFKFLVGAALLVLFFGCSKTSENEMITPPIAVNDVLTADAGLQDDVTAQKSVTITVLVENGIIVYRDSYNQQGKSIVTRAGYGVQIVWKLDPKSGIKEITNVNVGGDLFMLAEMPRKVSTDTWVARAATKGEGDVSYRVMVDGCKECGEEVLTEENSLRDPSTPYLRMP